MLSLDGIVDWWKIPWLGCIIDIHITHIVVLPASCVPLYQHIYNTVYSKASLTNGRSIIYKAVGTTCKMLLLGDHLQSWLKKTRSCNHWQWRPNSHNDLKTADWKFPLSIVRRKIPTFTYLLFYLLMYYLTTKKGLACYTSFSGTISACTAFQ